MEVAPSANVRWHYLAALLPAGLFIALAASLHATAGGQIWSSAPQMTVVGQVIVPSVATLSARSFNAKDWR